MESFYFKWAHNSRYWLKTVIIKKKSFVWVRRPFSVTIFLTLLMIDGNYRPDLRRFITPHYLYYVLGFLSGLFYSIMRELYSSYYSGRLFCLVFVRHGFHILRENVIWCVIFFLNVVEWSMPSGVICARSFVWKEKNGTSFQARVLKKVMNM